MATRMTRAELDSLVAATRLSRADARDLVELAASSSAAVSRPGLASDEVLARKLWQEELDEFTVQLDDQRLARDLSRAQREGVSLDAIRDRAAQRKKQALQQDLNARSAPATTAASTSRASATAPKPSRGVAPNSSICVICLEAVDAIDGYRAPCLHAFCLDCLDMLYKHASKDESLFPPRCCSEPLPSSGLAQSLPTETRIAFLAAKKEFSTRQRVNCWKCSVFLGGDFAMKRNLLCGDCSEKTCSACKAEEHGRDVACAADEDSVAADKLADQFDATRCDDCGRVLSRKGGCPHIVCLCGADLDIP
ncbi:hypothetical protein JCM8202_005483 [Rhodotorula sphaerocarpa]